MSWWSDFEDLFPHTIQVEPWVSEDSAGEQTYGAAVSYDCLIVDDVKVWKWEDGTEVAGRRKIYVSGESITKKDRITLPSGMDPTPTFPIWIVRRSDPDGYHHTEIYL